jgi:hypothetical protein
MSSVAASSSSPFEQLLSLPGNLASSVAQQRTPTAIGGGGGGAGAVVEPRIAIVEHLTVEDRSRLHDTLQSNQSQIAETVQFARKFDQDYSLLDVGVNAAFDEIKHPNVSLSS